MLSTTLLLWTGATALGLALPATLPILTSRLIEQTFPLYALPFAVAASMGTAQWLVLRRHFRNAGYWIPATTAGGGLGLMLGGVMTAYFMYGLLIISGMAFHESSRPPLETMPIWGLCVWMGPLLMIGLIMGLIVGFSQWLALRRFVNSSQSWLLFCGWGFALTPALLVFGPFVDMVSEMGPFTEIEPSSPNLVLWVVGIAPALLLPGLVTGIGLLRFLSDDPSSERTQDSGAS